MKSEHVTKCARKDEQASPDPSVAGCSVAPSSRHPAIFLIGYRGTGKSTVARLLADRLGWAAVDADALLELRAGRTIRAIFAEEGEVGFREQEAALLTEICRA